MYALPPAMVAEIKQLSISQLSRREELDLLRGRPSPPLPKHRSSKKTIQKKESPRRLKEQQQALLDRQDRRCGGLFASRLLLKNLRRASLENNTLPLAAAAGEQSSEPTRGSRGGSHVESRRSEQQPERKEKSL